MATETKREIAFEPKAVPHSDIWDEVQSLVSAYLAAWRVRQEDRSREIVQSARQRVAENPELSPTQAAIEAADLFLRNWFTQLPAPNLSAEIPDKGVPLETRIALVYGSPEGGHFADRTQVIAALRQGALNAARARVPSRPPETRAIAMQTSLSRLPSIRLIAGWFLLIGLLFLAFFLTH